MKELTILRARLADAQSDEEYVIIQAGIGRLQEQLVEMDTVETPALLCAWCLVEQGLPMGSGSHGICPRHAAQMVEVSHARRAARLANVA